MPPQKIPQQSRSLNPGAIDDPALGAAVFLVCLAEVESPLDEAKAKTIESWLRDIAGQANPSDMMTFARWASSQTPDINNAIRHRIPFWKRTLNAEQCQELFDISGEIATDPKSPVRADILRQLRSGLLPS